MFPTELETRFAEEEAALNRRRLRVMVPIMITLHVAHAVWFGFFHPPSRWRDLLVIAHVSMLPITVLAAFLIYRTNVRWVGPMIAFAYLQHGAWVAGIDQLVSSNITVYVGYCLGVAAIFAFTPRFSMVAYGCGAISMFAGLTLLGSPGARMTNLPTCTTLTVVSVAFAWFLYSARRREFSQKITIDRQRDELTALNAGLSDRVEAQVGEIRARAAEVDRLNAQLSAQVRARSDELSLALARLAEQRGAEGTLTLGVVLANRFEVKERLGKGGMGTVYAGIDRTSGARVAIKVIQAGSVHQLDAMRRFIREVGVAATITHPAVVRMLHLDISDDGLLFQAQELVHGETLTSLLAPAWPPGEAARLVSVLCDALAAAHAAGVVHRDIKPDNMMLTAGPPGLKLLDFGIAKLYSVARTDGTTERVIIGTPGYMAPEQAAAKEEITDRADVYAVGVTLFQLLTALPPEQAAPIDPFSELMARCLAEKPEARPSAAELGRALGEFADSQKIPPLVEITRGALDSRQRQRIDEANAPTTPHRAIRGDTPRE